MLSLVSETGEKPSAARVKDPDTAPLVRAPLPLEQDDPSPFETLDPARCVKLANGDMLFHALRERFGRSQVVLLICALELINATPYDV